MTTNTRIPNKAGWSLDECLTEHDPDIAELVRQLLSQIERERVAAASRYDRNMLLRLADILLVVAKIQFHISRMARLHQLARRNEYDRYIGAGDPWTPPPTNS